MVLVFDLDDTLYEEITFVKSGFRYVSYFLEKTFKVNAESIYQELILELELGRGKIFDNVLQRHSIYSKNNVKSCISIYRKHFPEIKLYTDAIDCLNRFKNYPIYIVTDGNKIVQQNKINALGLNDKVKFSFITHRYGIKNAKPSPYCFIKICEIEKTYPENVIYIGDNPTKDFVGIKHLGFRTIQIVRGNYSHIILDNRFMANERIWSLNELTI